MKVNNITSLTAKLKKLAREAKEQENVVVVGYSQRYAIWVHETNKNYRVGQWKYLEDPNRRLQSTLRAIIVQVYKKTRSMKQALLVAAFRLLRESQELCPEDTGALRASGYVAMESEEQQVAAAAFARSETIRLGSKSRGKK